MPFWSSKKVPDNLPAGGKLSEYGGPRAAVQYRLWLTPYGGKRFYVADPEFAGIIIAWRKAQQDLDYYINIELPVAVVWDQGGRTYREVILDTFLPKIMPPVTPQKKKVEEAKKEASIEDEERKRIADYLAASTLAPTKEEKPTVSRTKEMVKREKGKMVEFVPETISELQRAELKEAQETAKAMKAREKTGQRETEDGDQNPRKRRKDKRPSFTAHAGQYIIAAGVREPGDISGHWEYPHLKVVNVRANDYVAVDRAGNTFVVPKNEVFGVGAFNPKRPFTRSEKELKEYNGWTNYWTWNVPLWVDNEEENYKRRWQYGEKKRWTAGAVEMFVRELFPEGTPDFGDRHDYDLVNWQEIADNWNSAYSNGNPRRRRNLTPRDASWANRPYRGRTSFNLPEAIGMKNKHVLLVTGALVAGVIGLMWYASWKSRQVPLP